MKPDYYAMTDEALAKELGGRIKQKRLGKNLSQERLAELAGVSVNAVKSVEGGRATLPTLIAVLRELQGLDELMSLYPAAPVKPMDLIKLKGKPRQRARMREPQVKHEEDSSW